MATPIDQITPALKTLHDANAMPILIGAPGIGKSAVVEDYANSVGAYLYTLATSQITPTDLIGFGAPIVETKTTEFFSPEIFHKINAASSRGRRSILFIDEITHASPMLLAALMQLTHERRVGPHTLPQDCWIVAAGNRREDGGPLYNLSPVLTSRGVVITVDPPTSEGWVMWATKNDIHPAVTAFISEYPARLHDWDKSRLVNPTPRSWAGASAIIKVSGDATGGVSESHRTGGAVAAYSMLQSELLQGVVGPAALDLVAMLELHGKLPSFDAITSDPLGVEICDDHSVHLMLAGIIAAGVTDDTIDSALLFVRRALPVDVQVLTARMISVRDKMIWSAVKDPAIKDEFVRRLTSVKGGS